MRIVFARSNPVFAVIWPSPVTNNSFLNAFAPPLVERHNGAVHHASTSSVSARRIASRRTDDGFAIISRNLVAHIDPSFIFLNYRGPAGGNLTRYSRPSETRKALEKTEAKVDNGRRRGRGADSIPRRRGSSHAGREAWPRHKTCGRLDSRPRGLCWRGLPSHFLLHASFWGAL